MTSERDRVYSPTDIQELLGIDSSTLRKYAILLEKNGYHFLKNERGHRGYFDKDVITLRKLLEFSKQPDMTLERSAKAVMTWVSEEDITVSVPTEAPLQPTDERYNDMIERLIRLEEHNKRQEAFNQELLHQLQKQQQYIQESLERRDKTLMETVREIQETKLLTAATQQKRWWQFWK
ncbi:DUF3967 domain-containing protein [Ectobacillus funiculus]|jgi:hypothetical protein|uniref:DUF3967 domain-containing protein n=1 Tax=Ectobacillus funiculus TaxID=137993 RepID=UPI00101C9874|nr:DUF3967 domain-containing protein [Ectobacillus funiculus]